MRRGIVIPAASPLPLKERAFAGPEQYQEAVGGYFEPIAVTDPPLTIYVNEDGKSRRMGLNERATLLWWLLAPHARGHDLIVGDAVVVLDDVEAYEPSLLSLLQRGEVFRVEVQVAEALGVWAAGNREFDSWFEAARFALALHQRFSFVAAVRVVVG